MQSRWNGIALGSVVGVSLGIFFALLGAGLGLLLVPIESLSKGFTGIGIAAGSYLAVALFSAFFVGAFIASRLNIPKWRGDVLYQGLAVWGTSTCVMAVFFLASGGFGLFRAASQTSGSALLIDEIQRLNPRIVADLSLLQGKAVVGLTVGKQSKTAAPLEKEAPRDLVLPESKAQMRAEIARARSITAAACLLSFLGLLLSCIASVAGSFVGRPNRKGVKLTLRNPLPSGLQTAYGA